MSGIVEYLSGNVPGGITLYLLILIVVVMILIFMYRVNELFTRKLMIRWLIISFLFLTIVYVFLWMGNPPPSTYQRYGIDLFESNTEDNWLGRYLSGRVIEMAQPYVSSRNTFFPYHWLYRVTPKDSVDKSAFRHRLYKGIPVQLVLSGKIEKQGNSFEAQMSLLEFPSEKVRKAVQSRFSLDQLNKFLAWLQDQFKADFPLKTVRFRGQESLPPKAKLLALAKWKFFKEQYQQSLQMMNRPGMAEADSEIVKWKQYCRIKIAGQQRPEQSAENPYNPATPQWKKELNDARQWLIQYIQHGGEDLRTNMIVAESYIYEEQFGSAEIFLEKAYVENPFDIGILLDLSFLHPSRFQELGFENVRQIYRQILTICPAEEEVLLLWSKYILENRPAYTAPPETAKEYLHQYLEINPYSYKGWLMLGQVQARQRLRAEALLSYFKADSLRPNDGLIQYNIGVLYYEWDKFEKAKEYFSKSIQTNNYLDSYLYLGAVYEKMHEYKKALEMFRYRVRHKTGDDDVYAVQAMKGIRQCLEALGTPATGETP